MSSPTTLKELYVEEMKDLWSANEQMTKTVRELSGHVRDPKLKQLLAHSIEGITAHTATIKGLIQGAGGEVKAEHCKGMEGLVTEALKHGVQERPAVPALADIEIIAQYQRMSHYGIAGFGSAVAYAKALGMHEDVTKLKGIVSSIYKADEYASHLGEQLEKAAA